MAAESEDIEILQKKHAGYKDIESGAIVAAGRFGTTVVFRFDGTRYQEFHEETKGNP